MTVYLMKPLPKIPHIQRIFKVLASPNIYNDGSSARYVTVLAKAKAMKKFGGVSAHPSDKALHRQLPHQKVWVALNEHPLDLIRLSILLHAHVLLGLKALGHLTLQLPPGHTHTHIHTSAHTHTHTCTHKKRNQVRKMHMAGRMLCLRVYCTENISRRKNNDFEGCGKLRTGI